MLTQNLTDVVDESLCKVASKINEKKGLEEQIRDKYFKMENIRDVMAEDEVKRDKMEKDLEKTSKKNEIILMQVGLIRKQILKVKHSIDEQKRLMLVQGDRLKSDLGSAKHDLKRGNVSFDENQALINSSNYE